MFVDYKMVKSRKYVVIRDLRDKVKKEDFQIVEEELPPLKDGEVLIKVEWISVDPYLFVYPYYYGIRAPYDQQGYQVGIVEESKHADYPIGSRVVCHKGWRDYTVINPDTKYEGFGEKTYKLPDIQGLSPSLGVGVLGMPGVTAYYGFLDICKPKAGETVVVTGAAGAVGSIVGQLAKVKGCKVIGFAGSDEKVAWLENNLGFDKAFNYKTVDAAKALKEAAPGGVDCYFDNVGGELSSTIINQMNLFGRVSVCGCISVYGEDFANLPKATIVQPALVFKQMTIEGFHCFRWNDAQWMEAIKELTKLIKTGQIKATEHITEGFNKLPDSFIGMLAGENFGKAVVKV